jgi:allantoicase
MTEDFTQLVDLAAERLGGAVLFANDDFFASKDNLLKASAPVWKEGEYTDRGKWMDGWESRRRRISGHDYCLIRLGLPGVVRGVVVDTAFFRGNFPESCSIEATSLPGQPDVDEIAKAQWTEILPRSPLKGDSKNDFSIGLRRRFTHLRFNIFPDGGVARLRVHGEAVPDPRWMGVEGAEVDLASIENGARIAGASDMFFGHGHNLIMPGRGVNMGDGWETKRSRRPLDTADWIVLKLAGAGTIARAEVDTSHFKGNAPESCALEVGNSPDGSFTEILARTNLLAHTRHHFDAILGHAPATYARFRIFPDGGVSRLRLWGAVSREGRESFGVERLNLLTEGDVERELIACCGSRLWAKKMADSRPFASVAAMKEQSARVWSALGADDWHEAFAAHPRIGAGSGPRTPSGSRPSAETWAAHEQSKVGEAGKATLDALAEANARYEARFGHIYIVCATGKSAEEMLALALTRLRNDPGPELRVAAEEQRKITDIRLEKLVLR